MYGFLGILNVDHSDFINVCEDSHTILSKQFKEYDSSCFSNEQICISQFSVGEKFRYVFESESVYLIGRCRLDNSKELGKKLDVNESLNDLQLIALAYQKWGDACFNQFIGDFSFVLWDKKHRSLLLVKDQLGSRPLFFMEYNNLLYFSSSIPLLKSVLPFKPDLNLEYIAKELHLIHQEVQDTFFRDIRRLVPAHYLRKTEGKDIEIKKYWELEAIDLPHFKSDEGYYSLLLDTFTEAIKCRVREKTTIGSQLSGGMDSSAIAVLLSQMVDKVNLHTYSFILNDETKTYSKNGIDEQETQEIILSYANLNRENHHPIDKFHFKDVFHELEVRNSVMGGMANSDSLWQEALFNAASRNNVDVMFSGFPGDEGISNRGSTYFYEYLYQMNLSGILSHLFHLKFQGLKSVVKYFLEKYGYWNQHNFDKIRDARSILATESEFRKQFDTLPYEFEPSYKKRLKENMLRSHSTLRTESEGAYALQYGIEMVYPMADIRLLQLLYSLPIHLFQPVPYTRALFRNICRNILPEKVRLQPKHNGARTLAFVEYWNYEKHQQLQSHSVKNHTGLLKDMNEFKQMSFENDFMRVKREVNLKEADYLLEMNHPKSNKANP